MHYNCRIITNISIYNECQIEMAQMYSDSDRDTDREKANERVSEVGWNKKENISGHKTALAQCYDSSAGMITDWMVLWNNFFLCFLSHKTAALLSACVSSIAKFENWRINGKKRTREIGEYVNLYNRTHKVGKKICLGLPRKNFVSTIRSTFVAFRHSKTIKIIQFEIIMRCGGLCARAVHTIQRVQQQWWRRHMKFRYRITRDTRCFAVHQTPPAAAAAAAAVVAAALEFGSCAFIKCFAVCPKTWCM